MKVVVTPEAQVELNEIWNWNAKERGVRHADYYLNFLEKLINGLANDYHRGKIVGARSNLRYIKMRLKPRGNFHLAVYAVGQSEVTVVHIFHSAQDWENMLADEQE